MSRRLEAEVRALGYQPVRRAKHGWLFRHPCGATVQVPSTPSDHRSVRNTIAQARRALKGATS